jgi:butyryl-CoA dehydrogenase
MDFEATEEHRMIRRMVREFAEKEIGPRAEEMDETDQFPDDLLRRMGKLGIIGLPFPEEYGGSGFGYTSMVIALEEIARVSGSMAITLDAQTSLYCEPVFLFGTEEQKQKYLVPAARGEKIGAFGLTEPQAGSDAGATRTRAVRDEKTSEWVISGQKNFITNGSIADFVVITAKTDPDAGTRGISAFIVEKGTPGFQAGRDEEKMGLRGSVTSELFFENCRIPAENLLGTENEGFRQFMITLDAGRVAIAAMAVGLAQGAFERAVAYAKEREQFGRPIANFQAVRWMIADMATEIEAARLMVNRAAWLRERGERMYRDQRLCSIGEGTNQIQRLVISRQILGR